MDSTTEVSGGESRMVMAVAFWAIPELNIAKILKAAAKDTITTEIVILSTSQPGNTGNKSTPPTITTARFDKPNIIVLILRLSTIEEPHVAITFSGSLAPLNLSNQRLRRILTFFSLFCGFGIH
jgi:hypothetical protein